MSPAIQLFHCRDSRSFRVLWALEELELPYGLELMQFPPRVFVEGYRDVNPLGTVPALIVDGQLMTESSAIPHFLATRFGPSDLAVIVARHLTQAHRLQHVEHTFASSRRHRLAVEFDGHVRPRQGLDIVIAVQVH